MKTNNDCARGKYLLPLMTFILWMAGTMSLHAATDYGFWVGSVKVTSSNCNDITGGSIKSGTVKYNPNTNTLTLTDVRIEGTGSGGDVIHNQSREGLIVYFYGENDLSAKDTCAIWCQKSTKFYVKSGITTIYNNKEGRYAVYVQTSAGVKFDTDNNSQLYITAKKDYAIGGLDGANVDFGGIGNIIINGVKGALVNLQSAAFMRSASNITTTLKATNNSSYPIVKAVKYMVVDVNYSTATFGNPVITLPYKAEFKSTKKSICDSSGSPVYASDIKITNNYAVLVNPVCFPDANFRSYLENKFGSYTISQSQVNSCTSMDVSYRSNSSLEGISYFTELQTLYCFNNNLSNLENVSLEKLTTLDCRNNQLTRLGYTCSRLEKLYCGNNQLTTITWNDMGNMKQLYCADNKLKTIYFKDSGLTDLYCSNNNLTTLNDFNSVKNTLKYFYCENNAFTVLTIVNFTNLKEVRLSNSQSLQTIICNNNPALTDLRASNCPVLNSLTCIGNNSLTSFSLSSVPSLYSLTCNDNTHLSSISLDCSKLGTIHVSGNALTSLDLWDTVANYLDCSNNQLTSIVLPPSIAKLNCSSNSFTSFVYSGYLTYFNCSNNPSLTSLYLPGNNNLGQIEMSGCNALKIIDVSGCMLTEINMSYRTALEQLNCEYQKSNCLKTLNVTGCSALKKLSCGQNKLTSLNLTGCKALTEIDCSINQLTSITLPSSCPSLQSISCQANRISGNAMDALVAALPNRVNSTAGAFKVLYTGPYYEEGNVCLTTHVDKARAKNWNTYQTSNGNNWTLYAGGVPTDISTIEADNEDDAPRYNTSGQRVGRDYKGVVIVNGKKKVVK